MNKKTTHIIVTVGASLISNMLDTIEDKDRDLPKLNNLIWNRLEKAAISDEDDRRRYLILEKRINGFYRKGYKRIPNVTNKSKRWNDSDSDIININASAEITSIVKIYDDLKNGIKNKTTDSRAATQKIKITLLYTDTYLSQYCAGKIKDWLEYFKEEGEYPLIDKVDSRHIPNMKVYLLDEDKNNDDFYEEGLQNLMGILLNQYEKKGIINSSEYTILNYTGGYKSIIPMMTVVSLLEDVTLTYIYEESNTLLYLEELPIRWDWNTMESYSVLLDNRTLKDKGVYKYPIIKEIYIPFLLKNKLIKERSKGGFKMTSLGLSMKFYIEKNTFDAGSVLGHTMEYKLVDYYSPRKIFSRDVVIKGVNITTKNLLSKDFGLNNSNIKGNDIDVLIMNMDRGDYSILESKPLRKVIGSTPALNVFLTKTYKEVVKDYNTIFKDAVMDDSIRPDKQDTTKQFIAQMKLLKKYCNPHNEEGFLKQLPRKIIYSIHYQAPFEGTKESYEELINHLQFLYDGTTITDRMQSYKDFVDALFNQGKKETEKIQFEAQYVIVPRLGKTKFTPEARIKAKDIIPISLH